MPFPLYTVGYPGQKGQRRAWGKRCCHPLGTPDTSRRGLSTRKARRAFTSKPAPLLLRGAVLVWIMLTCSRITVKTLEGRRRREGGQQPEEPHPQCSGTLDPTWVKDLGVRWGWGGQMQFSTVSAEEFYFQGI